MKSLMLFRKKEKFTQDKFAKELGVSTSYYSKIESGNKKPSYEFICKFILRFPNVNLKIFFQNFYHE